MGWAFLFWLFISGLRDLWQAFIALIETVITLIKDFSDNKE